MTTNRIYFKRLGIVAAAGLLLVILLLSVFCFFLSTYEKTRPSRIAEEYLRSHPDALAELFKTTFDSMRSPYESWEQIETQSLDFHNLRCQKRATTDGSTAFTLIGKNSSNSETALGILTLRQIGTTHFGLPLWQTDQLALLSTDLSDFVQKDFIFWIPENAKITVNGIPYDSDASLEACPASPLNTSENLPRYRRCTLRNLLCTPDIRVLWQEGEQDPVQLTSIVMGTGETVYDLPGINRQTIQIVAPEQAKIQIAGRIPENVGIHPDQLMPYDDSHPIDSAAANPLKQKHYTISDLTEVPEITATFPDGTTLNATMRIGEKQAVTFCFHYPESHLHTVFLRVPTGSHVKVNGLNLSEYIQPTSTYPDPACEQLRDKISGLRMDDLYRIDKLYTIPEIEAYDAAGNRLTILPSDEKDCFVYQQPVSDEYQNQQTPTVTAFIDAYLKYTSNGYYQAKQHFNEMATLVLPNSPAYDKLLSSLFSFSQNHRFTLLSRTIECYDFISWGDNCFSCTVDFTAELYKNPRKITDSLKGMRLFFVQQQDVWLLAWIEL